MLNTHVRTVRDLRNNYPELATLVGSRDQVIITNRGKGEAVLIGIEDFADFEEYRHMKYVKEKLAEAEEYAKRPDAVWLEHDEVFASFRAKYGYDVQD